MAARNRIRSSCATVSNVACLSIDAAYVAAHALTTTTSIPVTTDIGFHPTRHHNDTTTVQIFVAWVSLGQVRSELTRLQTAASAE